jgi:hypothetical protein
MRLVEEDVSDLPATGIASIISQSNYLQSTESLTDFNGTPPLQMTGGLGFSTYPKCNPQVEKMMIPISASAHRESSQ